MEALVPAVIPGPCLVEDEGNDSLVDLNQHWVFVAFGPCRGGALSPPLQGQLEVSDRICRGRPMCRPVAGPAQRRVRADT